MAFARDVAAVSALGDWEMDEFHKVKDRAELAYDDFSGKLGGKTT